MKGASREKSRPELPKSCKSVEGDARPLRRPCFGADAQADEVLISYVQREEFVEPSGGELVILLRKPYGWSADFACLSKVDEIVDCIL